ncbi:helix-turn-helix transcriptional regulator [Actinocatenispora sera]|uniref:HTH luxR-type domain-containing protein n=1 Tax=Actinocatenispora sera TaxID=390989 RepID=A0A810L1D1_9ACTN|nr:LuxR family transcriptional regulator [Actinocatenispora sera]BCJ28462.1 hypothetical protein Asera_25700 [Actinocatenispora sera]
MAPPRGDSVTELLGQLAAGRGAVVALPRDTDLCALPHAGAVPLEIGDEPRLRSFALGPLIGALHAAGLAPDVPLIAAEGAPPRVVHEVLRTVRRHLAALPALLLVRDRAALDPVSRRWLAEATRAGDDIPVGWVVADAGTGAAAPDADPASPGAAAPDADPASPGTAAPDADPASTEAAPLDEGERVVGWLLAMSDAALTVPELVELSGTTTDSCRRTLRSLRRRGLVVEFDGHHLCCDPAARTRVCAELPQALWQALERSVLAVTRRRVGAAVLAERVLAVSRPEDPFAVEILTEAMDALADADPEAAADYGTAAVRALTEPDERLTAIAWRLLPLLWQTARVDEARRLARRVFTERGQAETEAQVLLWLARFESAPQRAMELATSALAIPAVPASIRAGLHSVQLRCLVTLGRFGEVDGLLPEALADATAGADQPALSRLQTCDAIRHFNRGDYRRALDLAELSEQTWRESGAPIAERMPEMTWTPHLTSVLGDPAAGLRRIEELLAELAPVSRPIANRYLYGERAFVLLILGRLAEAKQTAVLATDLAQRLWGARDGIDDRLQAVAFSVRLKVALHQGDPADLAEFGEILDRSVVEPGTEAAQRRAWWSFLLDDAQGRTTPERRRVDPASLPPLTCLDPADEVLLGRALLRHGWRDEAAGLVDRAQARVAVSGAHPLAVTVAAHLRGLQRADPAELGRARDGWHALGRPLSEAAALSDTGAIRIDSGDLSGLPLMQQAHSTVTELGADRDAWRIRWFLHVRGHSVVPEPPGAPALTPSERRVVDRAARGGAVRVIAADLKLSPHTVTTHLRHVYLKLGIRSRTELEEWVRAR